MKADNDIELRSDEVKDIISYIPSWIIRWGNTLILSIIFMILLGAYNIQYPDTITSEIIITTQVPPAQVVAKSSGRLVDILVKDNEDVKKDQVLAVIENTADYADIRQVKNMLTTFNPDCTALHQDVSFSSLQLGELEPDFSLFIESLKEHQTQLSLNPEIQEREAIQQQIAEYNSLLQKQRTQLAIYEEELSINLNDFKRNEELFKNKVLSAKEYEEKKKEYLQSKRNYENLKIALSNTKITLNDLSKSLTLLGIKNDKTNLELESNLKESLRKLKVAILQWEKSYLLQAPMNGKVSFFGFWTKNQYVKEGEEIFNVVPSEQNNFIGKLTMPIHNSGKVKQGQQVNICLENYPCGEWGTLTGTIRNISLVSQNGKYAIEVELPKGMSTSYHKDLIFKQQMQGTAKIVTEKLRLIDRIFYQFRSILNE